MNSFASTYWKSSSTMIFRFVPCINRAMSVLRSVTKTLPAGFSGVCSLQSLRKGSGLRIAWISSVFEGSMLRRLADLPAQDSPNTRMLDDILQFSETNQIADFVAKFDKFDELSVTFGGFAFPPKRLASTNFGGRGLRIVTCCNKLPVFVEFPFKGLIKCELCAGILCLIEPNGTAMPAISTSYQTERRNMVRQSHRHCCLFCCHDVAPCRLIAIEGVVVLDDIIVLDQAFRIMRFA